jgi:fucose permease
MDSLGGTNVLLTMWTDHAAAPLSCAHLGYGIGAVFINVLVQPFLSRSNVSDDVAEGMSFPSGNASSPTSSSSTLLIPYSITAVLCLVVALGHLLFYMRTLKNRRDPFELRRVTFHVARLSC